jgi:translation initiation factor IF-1
VKTPAFETEGCVIERARDGFFRVQLDGTDHIVLTRVANRLAKYHIYITTGDRVAVELSPDLARGRITYRL